MTFHETVAPSNEAGLFAYAATYLELRVIGIIQYLGPTLQMMVGLFYFGEVLSTPKLISFVAVWIAIAGILLDKAGVFTKSPSKS